MTHEAENLDPFAFTRRQTDSCSVATLTAKFDFVAAETEMRAMFDIVEDVFDAGLECDEVTDPLSAREYQLEEAILVSVPKSLIDVAIKLRVLTVPGGGIENKTCDLYVSSLAQVLAFLEGSLDRPGFDGSGHLQRLIGELRELSQSDNREATDHELGNLRMLLLWVESKLRRSAADWTGRRAKILALPSDV